MHETLDTVFFAEEPSKKKQKATEAASATETDAGQTLVMVSDELAKFFGSGEREMLQSEALKRVWDYIDTYQLKVTTTSQLHYLSVTIVFFPAAFIWALYL